MARIEKIRAIIPIDLRFNLVWRTAKTNAYKLKIVDTTIPLKIYIITIRRLEKPASSRLENLQTSEQTPSKIDIKDKMSEVHPYFLILFRSSSCFSLSKL